MMVAATGLTQPARAVQNAILQGPNPAIRSDRFSVNQAPTPKSTRRAILISTARPPLLRRMIDVYLYSFISALIVGLNYRPWTSCTAATGSDESC